MSSIFPFSGWRYDPAKTDPGKVVAPPYDVIGPAEQEALYARDGHNVIRLTLGRAHDDDSPRDNRYTRAASHLDAWRSDGLFLQDRPAVYRYEQKFSNAGQRFVRLGFLARVRLSEWGREGVYPHEKTLSGPKQDRLELMRATRGNIEPVFGLLADPEHAVSNALASLTDYPPCLDVADDDGVENRLWVVDDQERLHRLLSLMPAPELYIADGHHRYETALAYQAEIREAMLNAGQVPPLRGDLDCDYIMMLIVPDSDPGLVIWPTHRLVHGIRDFDPAAFLRRCEQDFIVAPIARDKLDRELARAESPAFGFAYADKLFLLLLKSREAMHRRHPDAAEAWKALDVSILHSLIMDPGLGIDEDKLLRKENITYSKSAGETLDWAGSGREGTQCAFILRPTSMQQVRDIAGAGAVMPQKSTYFYPKPLSGMVFNLFW